jgi:hypothetical protein
MNIKKLLFGLLTIVTVTKGNSQCQISGTANFSSSDACNSTTITVSGTAALKTFNGDFYTACGGQVTVKLEKYNPTTIAWTPILTTNTNGNYSFSINSTLGNGQYRVVMTNPNNNCSCSSTTNYTSMVRSLSFNSNATSNLFSFNGVSTFNTGCYNFNFCQGQAISMDNMTMTYPSSNVNTNAWRISTQSISNSGATIWNNYTYGALPSSFNLLSLLQTNYGTSVPAGVYGIQLQTYNGCTTATHYACLTILPAPTFSVAQKIDATNSNNIPSNTTCSSPYSNICPGTYGYILTAANTNLPANQITSGQWSCSLEETTYIKGCINTPTLVFNKPYTTISNMSNLNNIDLNAYATNIGGKPANYIYNTNKKWKFTLNIKYNCNNIYTYTCWLYYNSTGCRMVKSNMIEESTETLSDNALVLFPNPTNSNVEIKTDETITSITVYDINGKESKIEPINNNIDLSNFQSGIYTLKIYTENGISTKKIIKQD